MLTHIKQQQQQQAPDKDNKKKKREEKREEGETTATNHRLFTFGFLSINLSIHPNKRPSRGTKKVWEFVLKMCSPIRCTATICSNTILVQVQFGLWDILFFLFIRNWFRLRFKYKLKWFWRKVHSLWNQWSAFVSVFNCYSRIDFFKKKSSAIFTNA